jgi:hypothetical protein
MYGRLLRMKLKFNLGMDPTNKCRLKWRKLWDAYKKYVIECEKTGSGGYVIDAEPTFFDQLRNVMQNLITRHM